MHFFVACRLWKVNLTVMKKFRAINPLLVDTRFLLLIDKRGLSACSLTGWVVQVVGVEKRVGVRMSIMDQTRSLKSVELRGDEDGTLSSGIVVTSE